MVPNWKQLKCWSVIEWINTIGIFMKWNTIQQRE